MEQHLKDDGLGTSDHAWLVVDKDNREDKQSNELYQWSEKQENFGLALSNPTFEYCFCSTLKKPKGFYPSLHVPDDAPTIYLTMTRVSHAAKYLFRTFNRL